MAAQFGKLSILRRANTRYLWVAEDLLEAVFIASTLIFSEATKKVTNVYTKINNPFLIKEAFAER